jgi:hypothetical protein
MRQGGRQKGTPNKLTAQGRALIQGFLQRRTPEELEELWPAAKADSPSRAFRILAMLMEFAIPKLQRTVIAGDHEDAPIVIERRTHVFTGDAPPALSEAPPDQR